MAPQGLKDYFHRVALQNSTQYHTYCKACSQAFEAVRVMEDEEILMQVLADVAEDDVPDNGAIEIESDEEYHG
ncbi:hypothetical protein B0H10DRAFT_2211696 [Mycena sp. CBHHK59/15]|nr:hypothetical protein B0H10DRAFT_2211696 [Mycena sp. CBHHK59/15]